MKLGLGTVQFGLNYGISNSEGVTPIEEVSEILTVAQKNRIRVIDTAAMYGSSEEVLGKTLPAGNDFDIVTKTPKFDGVNIGVKPELLEQTLRRSLKNLNCANVYGLLMHNADDLLGDDGDILIAKMKELKAQGLVGKIGVSVYSSEQIDKILDIFNIDIIQLPISVLDQRLIFSGHLTKLKKTGVEIHARSVFLQGLLLMESTSLPSYFDSVRPFINRFHEKVLGHGLTPIQAALGFVIGLDEVDIAVCGVNNSQQLQEICNSLKPLSAELFEEFGITDQEILNPSLWRS